MLSIGISNLKSIRDSGAITLSPLTVFVGRNSSGKSSIIRSIPLFKQSTESKTLGTVLWSGKYVDYGSFGESLNFSAQAGPDAGEIAFTFKFQLETSNSRGSILANGTEVKLTVKVSGDEYTKSSYSIFEYEIFGNIFSVRYGSDLKMTAVIINGNDFTRPAIEHMRSFKTYSILPLIYTEYRNAPSSDQITSGLIKELKKHVHHRIADAKIWNVARVLRFHDDEHLIKKIFSNKNLVGEVAAKKMGAWAVSNPDFKKIRDQIIFCNMDKIVDQISDYVQAYFLSSRYITPLRAAADRYYRIQNTSIEELDPNGSNLAMFLHAKRKNEIEEINTWLRNEIGFSIEIVSSHGHASIFIIDEDGEKSNIADTGFGFSQVLPILIQIWHLSKNRARRYFNAKVPTTIIIEQPELHLHPRMQSRVGDAFCKALKLAKANGIDLRIIIETHSKEIIQSIGRCIEEEVIEAKGVAIYIVEKNSKLNIAKSSFDDGGYLQHWPYGFFDGE